jgi:RimJ/RimL family protein N-acetyltransferase
MDSAFYFPQDIILEDARVLLRPLEQSDVKYLLEISLNEPEIWKYALVQANGEENLIKYIQVALTKRNNKVEFPFIVFDKQSGKYAGSTRFYGINLEFKILQLGFTWYGKEFRGTGLNTHCKFLLLQFAFETLGIERVEFRADNRNRRSIAAMKNIGCKEEEIIRNHRPSNASDVLRDTIVLSILRVEWFGNVRSQLIANINHSN